MFLSSDREENNPYYLFRPRLRFSIYIYWYLNIYDLSSFWFWVFFPRTSIRLVLGICCPKIFSFNRLPSQESGIWLDSVRSPWDRLISNSYIISRGFNCLVIILPNIVITIDTRVTSNFGITRYRFSMIEQKGQVTHPLIFLTLEILFIFMFWKKKESIVKIITLAFESFPTICSQVIESNKFNVCP